MTRDKPERRILVRAVAELRAAFALRGYVEPFPFFHCPNEGELVGGVREAARRKQEGVTAGVPDVVVLVRNVAGHPSAIEIKAPGGRVSAAQRAMLEHFASIGFEARVTIGHRETAECLRDLGYVSPAACAAWIAWAQRADPDVL